MSAACLPPINVTLKVVSPPCPSPGQGSQKACNNNDIPVPYLPCSDDMCSVGGTRCQEGNEAELVLSMKDKFEPIYTPPAAPIDGRTTYKHSFVAHPSGFTKVEAIRPTAGNTLPRVFQQINDCKTEDQTWYKYQFPPHKVECYKKADWSRKTASIPYPGPMFSVTCYNQAYQAKQGQPAESAKPKHRYLNKTDEMDCSTTYQVAYQAWCSEPTCISKPHENPGFCNDCCVPFRGITTYKGDYLGSYQKPRVSYKPRFTPALGGFDAISTYRAAYEPYYFKSKPCHPTPNCDTKRPH